jgi:hypothetical protein
MDELECMRVIDDSLRSVNEEAAQARIAAWVTAKYGDASATPLPATSSAFSVAGATGNEPRAKEIAGIAKLSQTGEVQLTVRDPKAKSANDAAIRLVHVAIWASGRLTGQPAASSKGLLVPLLKKYRCYDGNTRGVLAKDKGLVRDGDLLSLDFHAEQFAEKVVREITDPTVEGKWKPGSNKRKNQRSIRESNEGV